MSEAEYIDSWGGYDDDDDDFCGHNLRRETLRLLQQANAPKQVKTPVKYSGGSIRTETVVKEVNGRVITSERQKDIKQLYDVAKAAKVGTMITCPTCKELHKKTTYHKVFCSNGKKSRKDCKSKYWNTIHPERLGRIF